MREPSLARMQKVFEGFLRASGAPLDDPNLAQTPQRAAQAWLGEFLDGYSKDPEESLGEHYPVSGEGEVGLVVVTGLRYVSVCPHHLVPYEGTAHLAYAPGASVVGFGRLSALLECLGHRLVLQEQLARDVARFLFDSLESKGSACILAARMSCFTLRGERQSHSRTHAEAYTGILRRDGPLRRELWTRLGAEA